jgi:hypothetical protein
MYKKNAPATACKSGVTAECQYEDPISTTQDVPATAYRRRITAECQYEGLTSTAEKARLRITAFGLYPLSFILKSRKNV